MIDKDSLKLAESNVNDKRNVGYVMIRLHWKLLYGVRVWCGVEWSGVEWSGVEWSGVVWSGVEWCGMVWCGVVLCGVFCDLSWCGVV